VLFRSFPDQADGGAQFWYAPEESPFKPARFIPEFMDRLPDLPQKIIRKLLVMAVRRNSTSPNFSAARIPFGLLSNFSFPMKFGLDHPRFSPNGRTVFDLLRDSGKKYMYHASPGFRVTMDAACERAEKDMIPDLDFAFFHIGNLDRTGHAHGPDSPEIRKELTGVDRGLERLYSVASERFDTVHFVVMGDHGMISVTDYIDVPSALKTASRISRKEVLYFLDSTMVRFWFFSDRAREKVADALDSLKGGRILSQSDRDRYHLNYPHNRFGDLVFVADPGSLILPNFFQKNTPVKGMHGYAPEDYGQQAALLIKSPKAVEDDDNAPVDMRSVFPTLCDLLDISVPPDCGSESLIIK
jgi:predicted AlkP superfamily pyrophosphatase or phosphodiesterase